MKTNLSLADQLGKSLYDKDLQLVAGFEARRRPQADKGQRFLVKELARQIPQTSFAVEISKVTIS